jgi:hypothetical protein
MKVMRERFPQLSDLLMGLTCCVVLLASSATARAVDLMVTNTNDTGVGSLRKAITDANLTVASDTIKFSIGSGAQKIKPLSALPAITQPLIIDGTTQPGYAGVPLIELDGSMAGASVTGLQINANSCTVKKLIINRFSFNGISITGNSNQITGNYIGTDSTGTSDQGNAQSGVSIQGSATSNSIGGISAALGNVISGNNSNGILISSGTASTFVRNNLIGTNAAGNAALGNTSAGIRIISSPNNIIGETTGLFTGTNVIAANFRGVTIEGDSSTGNKVESNYIGTNSAGATTLGNNQEGVALYSGASNNKIGGTTGLLRNVISRNGGGVTISGGAHDNKVEGNFIGANPAGTAPLGNTGAGVRVIASPNNTIGGTAAGTGNVIAANFRGVVIESVESTGNLVQGNFIGTNSMGAVGLGNNQEGVLLSTNSSSTKIGGTTSSARNVISGNGGGITVNGSTNNTIQGNFIGMKPDGTAPLGNTSSGIRIIDSSGNTMGGVIAGAGNVIAANFRGIAIEGIPSTGNFVQGNFIGTNSAGTVGLGNSQDGILLSGGAANNTIGGSSSAARNVISSNGGGIAITNGAKKIIIQGNYIGTNPAGTAPLGNTSGGIRAISSSGNTIGGVAAGAGNVIAASFRGITLEGVGSTGNFIQGNFIGTNSMGATNLGNNQEGVLLSDNASNNSIGGTTSAARNVITGNGGGIAITSGANTNKIEGNFIGTNPAGTAAPGNVSIGVRIIGGFGNKVGGNVAGAGNLISGNDRGVSIEYPESTGNYVQGNLIGTDVGGTIGLGNKQAEGILIYNAPDNQIGGVAVAARNVISANKIGIIIFGATATGNKVLGNYIGTKADGTSPLGNDSAGVYITSAFNNTIGGMTPDAGNVIAFNKPYGVFIGSGTGNGIRLNSIFENDTYGIDLDPFGITANDLNDPDSGPNKRQNFPLLTSVTISGNSTVIQGTLNTTPQTDVRVEFFSNPDCDPSGFGEGKTYIGGKTMTTDANGDVSFTATLPLAIADPFVTATTTNSTSKNTSEFSPCALVGGPNPGTLQFGAPLFVASESAGTATITVTRSGGMMGTVTVHYATSNGTAIDPDDYSATSGTLTFDDGEVIKTFTIPVVLDDQDEGNQETVNLKLTNPTGGATLGGQSMVKLFIIDYDKSLPTVFFSDVSVIEGQSGVKNAVFTITMTPHDQVVAVGYATADGTAQAGTDYVAKSGTLTFQPGQLSKTVAVQITGDTVVEEDEIFFLNVTTLPNATASDAQGEGLIINDD